MTLGATIDGRDEIYVQATRPISSSQIGYENKCCWRSLVDLLSRKAEMEIWFLSSASRT